MKCATVRCIVLQTPRFQGFKVIKWIALVYFNKSVCSIRTVAKFYSCEILQLNNYTVIAHKNFTVLKCKKIHSISVKRFIYANVLTINTIAYTDDLCSLQVDYANQHKIHKLNRKEALIYVKL